MFSVAYKARSEKRSVVRHQSMIDITVEVKLLQEFKDVLDELMIMTNVLREQLSVSKTFARHLQTLHRASLEQTLVADRAQDAQSEAEKLARWRMAHTTSKADDLLKSIEERIAELQRLVDSATDTASGVSHSSNVQVTGWN
jgi:DNA repair exonuclease SbcCD ATPase subunit